MHLELHDFMNYLAVTQAHTPVARTCPHNNTPDTSATGALTASITICAHTHTPLTRLT